MTDYRELSRRGLINMCRDYDLENDNDLFDFLNSHEGEYELIRRQEEELRSSSFTESYDSSPSVCTTTDTSMNDIDDILCGAATAVVTGLATAAISQICPLIGPAVTSGIGGIVDGIKSLFI